MALLLAPASNAADQEMSVDPLGTRSEFIGQPRAERVAPADLMLLRRVGSKVAFLGTVFRSASFSLDPSRLVNPDDGRPSILIPLDLFQELLAVEAFDRRSSLNYSAAGEYWVTIAAAIASTGAFADADRVFARAFAAISASPAENPLGKVYALMSYSHFLMTNGRLDDAQAVLEGIAPLLPRISEHSDPAKRQYLHRHQQGATGAFYAALAHIAQAKRNWREAVFNARLSLRYRAGDPVGTNQFKSFLAISLAGEHDMLPEAEAILRESVTKLDEIFSNYSQMNNPQWPCPCDASRLALADVLVRQGKWNEAATLAQRALNALPLQVRGVQFWNAYGHQTLAKAARHQGDTPNALESIRSAVRFYDALDHRDFSIQAYQGIEPRILVQEGLLATALTTRPVDDEILSFVQLPQRSNAAASIEQFASRYAASGEDAVSLVREQQDLKGFLRSFGAERSKLIGTNAGAVAKAMDGKYQAASQRLVEVEKEIARVIPRYAALASNRPVSLDQLRQHLREEEALVTWHIGDEGAWAIAIRKESSHIVPISARYASLRKRAQKFRSMVELRSGSGLGVFPARQAYELYQELFDPISGDLEGIKHVYVVPDDAFLDLPIAALVVKNPRKSLINPEESSSFRETQWLIDQHAITALPSVSSLVILRTLELNSTPQEGFFGIGDPVFAKLPMVTESEIAPVRGAPVDMSRVSLLSPLPETANELKKIGNLLAKDGGTILLGESATELAVKNARLDRYKVISFATHGIVAGELSGVREPGLILTTPKIATEEDDGILTASEISRLKLKSDWVILSACNTAAGGEGFNSAPLEGLARSFLYAGAKSLLVSHWAVDSLSTVELTTQTVELATQSRLSFAIAHQKAMQAMIKSDNPNFAHPSAWAAFFVVGVAGTPN